MRKNVLPPVLAVISGAVGFALRKWQLTVGFEQDTNLPIPGAPSALALILWTALTAGLILLLCWKSKERLPGRQAFAAAQGNILYLTAVVLSGFLLLLSAWAEFTNFSVSPLAGDTPFGRLAATALPPLRILFCVGGLPCTLLWARSLYRGGDVRESLPLLEPCFLFCLWLISDYQVRAADPVTQDYLYEVLAIVCALLGLYFLAGYSFQTGKPRRTVFFCLMGAYFSLVTLADGHTWAELARCGFAALFLTAHAALVLNPGAAPAEDETDNIQTEETVETEAENHG